MNPLVSVVMPAYNAEPYIQASIDSILHQTFTDFELIIIDDCSSDRTPELIQNAAIHDSRVIHLSSETNQKAARARNQAMAAARGEYIAVQDADDISLPDRLAKQVSYLDSFPRVSVVGSSSVQMNAAGKFMSIRYIQDNPNVIHSRLLLACYFQHSTAMFRRSLLDQVGGYQAQYSAVDDHDLFARFLMIAQFGAVPDILMLYRSYQSSSRVSFNYRTAQFVDSAQISAWTIQSLMPGKALDEEAYRRFWLARQCGGPLQRGDIKRLDSLWSFLAASPIYHQEWAWMLFSGLPRIWRANRREALQLARRLLTRFQIYRPATLNHIIHSARLLRRSLQPPLAYTTWLASQKNERLVQSPVSDENRIAVSR